MMKKTVISTVLIYFGLSFIIFYFSRNSIPALKYRSKSIYLKRRTSPLGFWSLPYLVSLIRVRSLMLARRA